MEHNIKTTDDLNLFVTEMGSGFPLVFLHGNKLTGRYFSAQQSLSDSYRLIFIDSRGHGKSSKTLFPLTFSQLADDLESVLAYLNISTCLIIGHSDGANLALSYVQQYPKRVGGLLLNGGNFLFSALNRWVRIGVAIELFLLKRVKLFCPRLKTQFAVANLLKEDIPMDYKRLASFQGPVLVLVGEKEIVPLSHSNQLANAFPNGQLIRVPKLGHHIANRQSKLFNRYIIDLVSRIQKEDLNDA
ncbi:alpha/beta fold hydrolase [Streptococcus dysgalactiae]